MLWQYLQVYNTYKNHNLLFTAQTQSTNKKFSLVFTVIIFLTSFESYNNY